MMAANITTEVSPIVGSEKQSEELVHYLLHGFEDDPKKIWESNIFGTSLHELVNQGLHNKLYRMPADARMKLQETIERIINHTAIIGLIQNSMRVGDRISPIFYQRFEVIVSCFDLSLPLHKDV